MRKRALVLGAGGPAASSWETGIIAGLADAGIDVRNADLFIGTSAGSRVAAQITSGLTLEELFQRQVDPRLQINDLAVKVDFRKLKEEYAKAKQGAGGNVELLKRMGAFAITASTVSESQERDVVAAQLPQKTWPASKIYAVAVDAESGQRHAFERSTGVPLVDAVAASGAAPGMSPVITIEGRRYMDGGCYSIDNADLAAGHDRVLILTLKAGNPPSCIVLLPEAVKILEDGGAQVVVVHPDEATEAAFAAVGGNLLDSAVKEGAARAGRAQGKRIARLQIAALWQ
jgi:NTE family protein